MLKTFLLTLLAPLFFCGNYFACSKKDNEAFLQKDYTNALKGLCCLVVIYVHMSSGHGNILQDAIGSFAYVAVTMFFLFSAYGMKLNVEKKATYLKSFWRNRLVALLIPCLLVNTARTVFGIIHEENSILALLFHLSGYVAVLLQWCLWFYVTEWCRLKWFSKKRVLTDWVQISGVIISSLYLYLFVDADYSAQAGWCFERIGLVWGILLYRYLDEIKTWMNRHHWIKTALLMLFSGVLGIAYLKYKTVYFWGAYFLKIILGFVIILLFFTATSDRKFGNKANQWLGNISYEVYLSHGMVMTALSSWLPSNMDSGLFIFLTVCTTMVLSKCLHTIGKPIVSLLRKD